MIRLSRVNGRTNPEDLWSNNRMRLHFGSAIRVGNLVIGSSGDFGPAFMVALNTETGEEVWRERTFARAQMVNASGTLVIVDEDGEIAVASASEAGPARARAQGTARFERLDPADCRRRQTLRPRSQGRARVGAEPVDARPPRQPA